MSGECDKCGENCLDCRCKGWVYKGKEDLNRWRKLLKEMPLAKIEIIPDDPKDQKVADQINNLLRHRPVP